MISRLALALLAALVLLSIPRLSPTQQFSDACYTRFGVCRIQPAGPIGTWCTCYGDPGQIGPPPAPMPPPAPTQAPISYTCQTHFGVCQVPPAPVGSPCFCYGDPGVRR